MSLKFGLAIGAIAGISMELLFGTLIVLSLVSQREFNYDSFVGWLLTQYVVIWNPSILSIVNLVLFRVFCFFLMFFFEGWMLLLPAILYLIFSCVHVLPPDTSPMD